MVAVRSLNTQNLKSPDRSSLPPQRTYSMDLPGHFPACDTTSAWVRSSDSAPSPSSSVAIYLLERVVQRSSLYHGLLAVP
jgi:hypothetical protein